MENIYGKLIVRIEERDEYNKVIKVSTFSLSNITIEYADAIASEYEAKLNSACGFRNYSITRTFKF